MPKINISNPRTVTDLNLGFSLDGYLASTNSNSKLGGTVNLTEFPALTSFVCIDNDIEYNDEFIPINNIRVFNVKNNKITSFPKFENYPKLGVFNFSNNSISNSKFDTNIFESVSATLNSLDISNNELIGTIPSVSSFSVLESINLSGNSFTSYNEVSSTPFAGSGAIRVTVAGFTGDDEHLNGLYDLNPGSSSSYSQVAPSLSGRINRLDTAAGTESDSSIIDYYWEFIDSSDNSPGTGDQFSNTATRSDSSPTILQPYQMTWSGGLTVTQEDLTPSQIGLYNQNLTYFNLRNNSLSSSGELNALLLNLSGSGGQNGFLDVSGPSMPSPSLVGLSARNGLINRGWNININELEPPEFLKIWNFPSPVSASGPTSNRLSNDTFSPQTIAWRISGHDNVPITLDPGDGSPKLTFFDNLSASTHTFVSGNEFNGVSYSLPHRIEKFVSRLDNMYDGEFDTYTYQASGNVDLQTMPGLLEFLISDHKATFTNFNTLNRNLIKFQFWNNEFNETFSNLDLSRFAMLSTFSVRGSYVSPGGNSNKYGNFTGDLHSVVPATLERYNVQFNSLSGSLPTFTTNFNNIQLYQIGNNSSITGELKDLTELGKTRTGQDVQFKGNGCSITSIASDFTVSNNLQELSLRYNDLTQAALDSLLSKLAASSLSNSTIELRNQDGNPTATDSTSFNTLTARGNTVNVNGQGTNA